MISKGEKTLNNKRWPLVILSVLLTIFMLISLGCTRPKTDPETSVSEQNGDSIKNDSGDSTDSSGSGNNEETKQEEKATDIPEAFSFAEIDNRLVSLDDLLRSIGIDDAFLDNMVINEEPENDNIHGTGDEPGGYTPEADIIYSGSAIIHLENNVSLDNILECWSFNPGINAGVFCSDDKESESSSELVINWFATAEPIPLFDDSRSVMLFMGYDSNGDPGDDYQPDPQFPKDFFHGLDRVYMANYSPQIGWSYMVLANLENGFTPVQSNGIGVIRDNLFILFTSTSEVDPSVAGSSGGIHIHDGSMSLESTGANVFPNGDPTLPPDPFNPESIMWLETAINPDELAPFLPPGFTLCGIRKCKYKTEFGEESMLTSCECQGCTDEPGCTCNLFIRKIAYPTSISEYTWNHIAGPGDLYPHNVGDDYWIICFCVKENK